MKKHRKQKNIEEKYLYDNIESDEYFYYIAGYTSNGVPYGITWEEARADGLINLEISKDELNETDIIPF